MGRGEASRGNEFDRRELAPSLEEVKKALTTAVSSAFSLTRRAARPQLACWVVKELLAVEEEDELLGEAASYLALIAAGGQLTSADMNLVVALCERLEEWRVDGGSPYSFRSAASALTRRAVHLALKSATLPARHPLREQSGAAALRSALYALAFKTPEALPGALDRIEAGLLLADLGPGGATLIDESEPPEVAAGSWLSWEREVEMTLEDAHFGEIDIFMTQVARLRQRPLAEALALVAGAVLDARVLVANEDWTQVIDPFLRQLAAGGGAAIDQETLHACLIALDDAEETAWAYEAEELPKRRRGESEADFLRRRRLSEMIKFQAGQATRAVVSAARAAVFAWLGEGDNVISLAERALVKAARSLAYVGNSAEYERLLLRLTAS
jgi:hypothetical protein